MQYLHFYTSCKLAYQIYILTVYSRCVPSFKRYLCLQLLCVGLHSVRRTFNDRNPLPFYQEIIWVPKTTNCKKTKVELSQSKH